MKPYVLKIEIDPKKIVDQFTVACEGGSNYWCKSVTPVNEPMFGEDAYSVMLRGFHVEEIDEDAAEVYVSPRDIQKAIDLWPNESPQSFTDFLNDDGDANTADIFLQLCAFQRVVYG